MASIQHAVARTVWCSFLLSLVASHSTLKSDNHDLRLSKLTTDHGLVLVPQIEPRRFKRAVNSNRKYRRLSHSVKVQSDIRYRYATTLVTSEVYNPESRAREIFMTVILPDTAFISRFAIEIEGQLFVAYVREKEDAWKEYQEAVGQGKTAGHVGISARHSNQFRVSVNTEAKSSVTFYLLYEELLHRRRGVYEHVINLTPRQKLSSYGIDVQIVENLPLRNVVVPPLRRKSVDLHNKTEGGIESADVIFDPVDSGRVKVHYRPSIEPLQKLLKSNHALQFSVIYDVERPQRAGEVQVVDGYFVHFVAPENLEPMAKHVVFVLDVSGSMNGKKLVQLKKAMRTILSELRPADFMSIVEFSDDVAEWRANDTTGTPATAENVRDAIDHVDGLEAMGGTNIYAALVAGLTRAKSGPEATPMIVFLTDGHPTVGVTERPAILADVQKANAKRATPLFSLSFGRFADFDLMKALSLQNHAFSRKIYIAADAALQLEGFYKEVPGQKLWN